MNRSTSIRLARVALLTAVAATFSSCTVYDDGYYRGPAYSGGGYVEGGYAEAGYDGGGYDGGGYDGGGYDGGGYRGGGYRGGEYAGGGYYYGDRYYQDEWYGDYYDYHPPVYRSYVTYSASWPHYYGGRYYSYRWWNDDRYRDYCHDHGSNSNRYRKRRGSEEMKLVRYTGPDRGRLPSGYHSEKWYKDRGYNLKTNTYRERDGDVRGRQSSSSQARSKKDDRPTSQHPRALKQPETYRYTGNRSQDADRRRDSSRSSRSDNDSRRSSNSGEHKKSSSSSDRSRQDDRPSSQHPRAKMQPDKYRYTSSGGGNDRSDRSNRSQDRGDRGNQKGNDRSGDKDGGKKGKKH